VLRGGLRDWDRVTLNLDRHSPGVIVIVVVVLGCSYEKEIKAYVDQ
jgi:hypothetical protein